MTKPDWCPQWAWDIVDAELAGPGVHVHRISYEIVSERIARVLLAAERQGMERNAETIRRLQDKMSQMAMDWTKAMTRERLAGFAEGMERAAEIYREGAGPEEWGWDYFSEAYHAIRAAAKEIEP